MYVHITYDYYPSTFQTSLNEINFSLHFWLKLCRQKIGMIWTKFEKYQCDFQTLEMTLSLTFAHLKSIKRYKGTV